MDVSYRWLEALVPGLDATPEEVAGRLAARGAPIEGMTALDEGLEGVVVGRVRAVREHPNADRLVVCDVEGGGEEVQVVCGAPNVEAGGLYPFAPVGVSLPNGMEIGQVKIRGQTSRGMLCSEKELGLGPGHEGLLELPEGLQVGVSLASALGLDDVRLDVEVTPNRGDLLSHVGVAREVALEGDAGICIPDIPDAPPMELEWSRGEDEATGGDATIRIDDPEGCWRYLGAVIRGVSVGPSPEWLRARLRAAGARPVNNVVDATNYVLLEMGQPLHAFDLSRLAEDTVVVRRASEGESIRTLDGVERSLTPEMLCICDADEPVAVAGVMGGEESEVGEETVDILLECALFEPTQVRATRMALGMSTDASYRFERGVDPEGMETALARAVEVILATAGGEVAGPVLDAHPRPREDIVLSLRLGRIEALLGVAFSAGQVGALLEPLGFEVQDGAEGEGEDRDGDGDPDGDGGPTLAVRVPGWRRYDVTREADLIEEVARSHGYDAFPDELGAYRPGSVADHPLFILEDRIRDLLVGRGFLEGQVPAFAPESEGEVALSNPISAEESHLRSSLLPGLVRRVERNFARGVRHVRLFELGTCFFAAKDDDEGSHDGDPSPHRGEAVARLPREESRLALVATGARRPPHWSGHGTTVDVWDLKGWLEEVGLVVFGARSVVEPGVPDEASGLLDPEMGFTLLAENGDVVGWGGRIRADAVEAPPWAEDVWAFELSLPPEPEPAEPPIYREPSPFPGVGRDFALVIPDDLTVKRVREVIEEAAGDSLSRLEVFDLYRGEEIPEGTRSVAFRLHFSSRERTLTDEEVDRSAKAVVDQLEEELGVRPRS